MAPTGYDNIIKRQFREVMNLKLPGGLSKDEFYFVPLEVLVLMFVEGYAKASFTLGNMHDYNLANRVLSKVKSEIKDSKLSDC